MRTVAVVPIKLNSRRLPNKNIRRFTDGKPLCFYAVSTLLQTEGIDEVYVYCSSEYIKKFIPTGVKYLKRPTALDQDETTMNEVLKQFAKMVEADIYVLVHVTAPFISCGSIKKGVDAIKSGQYDSAFSVKKIQDFFWENNQPQNYKLDSIPRTQDLPVVYQETSGFYAFKQEVLLKAGRRIGDKALMIEVGEIEAIDIDEEEDFMIADAINYFRNNVTVGDR